MKKFKILDCTLRDGGYYTNWCFDEHLVQQLVYTLDNAGVDIIELGYKSPFNGGPFRKCNDGYISYLLSKPINASLAFMIDVKDFISDGVINDDLLLDIIKPVHISPFKICRIATKGHELQYLPNLINLIQELGYTVICNLMSMSTVSNEELLQFNKICNDYNISVAYLADSYGSIFPNNVAEYFDFITGTKGIHTHDNLSLAFANCLSSIDAGVEYIDGTVLGMGRGVGNVKTEQLLMYRDTTLSPAMIDLIKQFEILKSIHRWGYDITYMYAGLNHIHPLYAHDVIKSNIKSSQLISVLQDLNAVKEYESTKLSEIYNPTVSVVIPARFSSSRFPGKPLALIHGKPMIVHVAEKACQAVGHDNVYIATESPIIADVVKRFGYKVILTSDTCLTGTDRVAEASRELDSDIIINVQGDEPLIDPYDIINVIKLKQQYPGDVINCMSRLHPDEDPHDIKIPKVVCNLDKLLLYSSRSMIPGSKQGLLDNVYKQVCIYAFNKDELSRFYDSKKTLNEQYEDIEILRCLEKGMTVRMLELTNLTYSVDYAEDIKKIESYL
jgi:3-deoxy-manno-octulosonate cytidylyltransferase (CMP-KDO synthetase)